MTNAEWLKDHCNRYREKNPQCNTTYCLKRGGWKHGDAVNCEMATCHAHEVLKELEELENKYQAACGWH